MIRGCVWIVAIVFLYGCRKDAYHQMVAHEAATGKRYDSLFYGISFGMERKEFYDACWKLNKEGIAKQGPANMSVEYTMTDLKEPVLVRFYPNFYEERIYEVPSSLNYVSWAPWNKHLSSDTLLEEVKVLMEKKYGPGFIEVKRGDGKKAYVLVNGNRRISLYTVSEQYVHALYTDLTVEEQAERLKREQLKNSQE